MAKITDYITQIEREVICHRDCTLTLDLTNYGQPDSITFYDDRVWVKSLISVIEFDDKVFNLILDYAVDVYILEVISRDKEHVKIKYPKDSVIIGVSSESSEIKGQIQYVERLLGGREILKDVPHLYKKLLDVYSPPLAKFDSVHLEVLCSEVLRNKTKTHLPARIVEPYDPELMNIKKVVFSGGFIQGIAFENIGQAVRTGLIAEEELEPSIIEKIVTGEVIETKKRRF